MCFALGVSRSWLYYKPRHPSRSRRPRRPELGEQIRSVLATCPPTYGYRKVHALLQWRGVRCTLRTVHRWLKKLSWLSSARCMNKRPGRLHEGQVAVPASNSRWASDITIIQAWNREKIRLAVILDCGDRMVVAYRWGSKLTGEDLGDLVREAVFNRFGDDRRQARGIEFLSDNGPEYISAELQGVLNRLGLVPCHTPIRSPQSNGIAEGFFSRFKRDYVYQNYLANAEEVGRQIKGWIGHYNHEAPHGSLGMQAPARYYAQWLADRCAKFNPIPVQK